MAEFHETGYGRTFFEYQLPELIKQLKRIADALVEQNKPDIVQAAEPMDFSITLNTENNGD